MKRNLWSVVILICFSVLISSPAYAFQFNSPVDDLTIQNSKLAWQMSQVYQMSITTSEVGYMKRDLEYGEIALLYGICEASNKSPESVLAMRIEDKLQWSDIADKLGVDLSLVNPKVKQILSACQLNESVENLNSKFKQEKENPGKAALTPSKRPDFKLDTSITKTRTYNPKSR